MSKVFVIDSAKKPLDPVHPARARILLKEGKAAVYRQFPFTLILKVEVKELAVQPLRLKLDPGSRTTGIAVVNDATGEVVFAAELIHRGQKIKAALDDRRAVRRSRRTRKTRYRKPRWQNRARKRGWLPPSLISRISNVQTWVKRLLQFCPITAISLELVKFDLQLMENAEVRGIEYQQGTLAGYETRGYLLEKWNHHCSYCDAMNTPLQVEHIQARAKGGSNRVSNLCLACEACNTAKGTLDLAVFLKKKPDVLKRIQAQCKAPLKDAAAVNSTRWALYTQLQTTGLPIECASGGLTKFNRTRREMAKTHWGDACNVGTSTPEVLVTKNVVPLLITATGHGSRQMCSMNRFGFARTGPKQAKRVKGLMTGDMVRAVVTSGVHMGTYVGKVAVRATGSCNITTSTGKVQGISSRFCTVLHHADGYSYQQGGRYG